MTQIVVPASAQRHRRQQQQNQKRQLPGRSSTPCAVCVLSARPSATPPRPYAGFNASLHGTPQPLGFAINATAVAAAAAASATAASAGGAAAGNRGGGARAALTGSPRGRGFLFVPRSYDPGRPSPLAVMLHGAGGRADPLSGNWTFGGLAAAEDSRLIIVVPESAGRTWDAVRGGAFGPDVAALDGVLAAVFAAYAVDAGRVALAGHSDGASYALSLGLGNPQLFTHLLAFSPGFMRPPPAAAAWLDAAVAAAGAATAAARSSAVAAVAAVASELPELAEPQALRSRGRAEGRGRRLPRVFVAHGQEDEVLPVRCSHRIVSRLRAGGLDVEFMEFHGLHSLTREVAAAGLRFFLKPAEPASGT
ncbi:hypothetical protein HXX76_013111 [Chlamydomonas incerta]|uniref:Phospholipase/carboxylesterase/thioesterase domain-containing protein n=1 Tax=Chlamydomonas incerta TaxID=51695 RepID=A0A835SG44_CHLIN|nr:hypothetical protein HXX76_013111 [Chlamydomonas incerta]|eukprot:KAG2426354.1 hypothetical protein HXX76_013111 [Chlamydomonas incerta]